MNRLEKNNPIRVINAPLINIYKHISKNTCRAKYIINNKKIN